MNLLEKLEAAREKSDEFLNLLKSIDREIQSFENTRQLNMEHFINMIKGWQDFDYNQCRNYLQRQQEKANKEQQEKNKTLDEKLDEILKILREELNDKPKEASMDEMEGNTENGSRA